MLARLTIRLVLAATALFASLDAAWANFSVRYDGSVLLDYSAFPFQPHPDMLNGTYEYSAIFYYDDLGAQRAASLIVDGRLRSHYTICAFPEFSCPALAISPTSIFSAVVTTPEDGIEVGVFSPGQFGGLALLGQRKRIYDLVPGDMSNAYVSWALFDNETGFAWNSGQGDVTRLTVAVPEPTSWVLLVAGFGLAGAALRRQRSGPRQRAASAAVPPR